MKHSMHRGSFTEHILRAGVFCCFLLFLLLEVGRANMLCFAKEECEMQKLWAVRSVSHELPGTGTH